MAASMLDPLEQERSNLGFITANIVHLQYYTNIGTIKNNEIVELVREPENPSEPNAIKVLNLRGKQLGHVEQSIAELLAPFMDNRSIFIEGFVPKSIPFVYEMPCQIFVSTCKNSMSKILKALAEVGLNVITSTDQRLVNEKIQYPKKKKIQDPKEAPNPEENIQDQNGSEELINLGLPKRGKAVVSSDTVVTPLSEHQKATLAWMVERENSNSPELPSFWHVSSEPGTKEAKAAIALKSQRRWAVISTPTGNTSLDVSLLLDFLKFKPSSVQRPVGQGSSIHPSDMQDLTETLSLRRTKELNEQSLVIRKAVINVEGSDGYGKDGQSSMEAKEIEEKKGEEEQEEVEETLYEMREVPIQKTSPKIENGAQARAYFGALFGDLEGPNFDLNITTSPLHDIVEGSLHADVGRLKISQVEDVDAGVADVSHQPIKIDSEASLDKCTPSYEDNQVEGGKKEGNVKEDGDNKDDNEDGIDIRSDSLGTMLEAAETSSLSRDQAKKLLLRVVNIALGGNDPWQERTNKLMEEINTMQVEMTSLRNCVPLKDEVVNKYVKCIQCEEWSEILAKAWEEVNRISGNQSGLLDVQSTNLCDDPVLAPSIYSLRWMTNMLKQRVEVELVYRAYGCDMLCQNEELTKSLDAVKEELVGVKEELEETKATLACSINTAKEERRFERRLREKMENDLADLRKENKQMKKEKDKILQASKILFEENKDLMKKLIVAGSLTTTSPSQAMVGSTSATVHAIVDL